jgi:hypothetical protein
VEPIDPSQKLLSGPDVDTIERLKSLTDFSDSEWLELIEIKYQDYITFIYLHIFPECESSE